MCAHLYLILESQGEHYYYLIYMKLKRKENNYLDVKINYLDVKSSLRTFLVCVCVCVHVGVQWPEADIGYLHKYFPIVYFETEALIELEIKNLVVLELQEFISS